MHIMSMCIHYLNDRDSIIYMSIHKVEEVEFEYKFFYHTPNLFKWL